MATAVASAGPAAGAASGAADASSSIVVARYAYKAVDESELTVKKSERLLLLDDSQHWWRVQNASGHEGYVPSNYMKRAKQGLFSSLKSSLSKKKKKQKEDSPAGDRRVVVASPELQSDAAPVPESGLPAASPAELLVARPESAGVPANVEPPPIRVAVARFAYAAAQEDELTLARGDRIAVLEESSDGWWRGRLLLPDGVSGGGMGWFPSNYVAEDSLGPNGAADSNAHEIELSKLTPKPNEMESGAPAAAAVPIAAKTLFRVLALYKFTASHSEEMDFDENETLSVVATPPDDPEWWLARNSRGQQGLVPRNYVRPLPPEDGQNGTGSAGANPRLAFVAGDSLADRGFYWGRIGRSEADRMLMQMAAPGEFIVRAGESNPQDLTLTMRAKAKNRNFKIRRVSDANGLRYNIGQKYFSDLEDLIRHYREHPIYKSDDERCFLIGPFQHPSIAGTML
ncbi:hypothetical protein BOX15_Mlig016475g2 [Macrostomum lignano]|uniref:Cytoplasmic protein NCK2 n=1 Tax=Macrostomum lignano TaxID=282301 RepID=A0A267G2T1_9PLAT|nr:hypothetical protein BOX15_Mlig016475g2 [Macrostomum lignano]